MSQLPSDKFIEKFSPLREVKDCEFIRAHQAVNFFDFWDALEKDLGSECIPFWGAVWPAAKSLARFIRTQKGLLRDKTVLDFGCGSGIVSIASAMCGASRVIANDIDPVALYIAQKNFKANGVNVDTESIDLLNHPPSTSFDLVFVVDMFYERHTSQHLLQFLYKQIEKGAEVIISDGNRPFAPRTESEILFEEELEVDKELEGVSNRAVKIMRLQ
ncbi:MAG: methyltransferase [Fibrobacter sp.]|jgi:predicted nicotinamide N-methyase|nr:methyltransferase [Fibrobacter sp.]